MTTGQIACYKTGQLKNPQHSAAAPVARSNRDTYNDIESFEAIDFDASESSFDHH
jgi:hypothetical protein